MYMVPLQLVDVYVYGVYIRSHPTPIHLSFQFFSSVQFLYF